MNFIRVILKPEKEKPLRAFHPWIFSGAIDRLDDGFKTGDLAKVYSNAEEFLGLGYLNPRSQIAIRMLTFQDEPIDTGFFERRMEEAKRLRETMMPRETNAIRLIHSEGDFLPGLIVDRYGDYLVTQFLTAGMDILKPTVLEAMKRVFSSKGIYERDDSRALRLEGLEEALGVLGGEEPPDYVEIKEYGHRFIVDIKHGQKTGFFLDQRENRKLAADHAQGKRVLNCFAYSGGFSIYAAKAGAARVVSVETNERALNTCRENFRLNVGAGLVPAPSGQPQGLPLQASIYEFIQEDVFEFLRKDTEAYDLVILDPPAFCKNKNQIQQAARGYKDINLFAMKRLTPGGILFTSSCSSFIDPGLFQKIIFGAAKDAARSVQIIQKTSHSFDHPISIYHPEGEYLKGLFLRVQ